MTITNAVIIRINQLCKQNKITKRQLARNAHLSEGTLASISRQLSAGVSLTTICALAKGFGMTMSEFLDDEVFEQVEVD